MSMQLYSSRTISLGLTVLVATCAVGAQGKRNAKATDPDDPNATVFLSAIGESEGAPSKKGLKRFVVLSEVGSKDPYYKVTKFLLTQGADKVIRFRVGSLDKAFAQLKRIAPGNVAVVIRPQSLDVRFHFEFLERASRLDRDPFVDFAFGYLTGSTAEEALSFVKGIAKARKKQMPRNILEFGPSSRPKPRTPETAHAWADKFKLSRFFHKKDSDAVAAELASLKRPGILMASGHGMPDGVAQGLKGHEIRKAKLDLFPALYFSGPCFCGVTNAWMDASSGRIAEKRTPVDQSFVLALIAARVTAVFAGLNPDRGETNLQEFEHVLFTGEPLGMASKSTYDDAVLAYRRPEFTLPEYTIDKPRPFRNLSDQMISGGACRALFGDPTFAPFAKAGDGPFAVTTRWSKKGLTMSWKYGGSFAKFWSSVDVYHANGGWTRRLRFRFTIPRKKAMTLKSFRVVSVTKDGEDVETSFASAGLELWGGEVRVHARVIFPDEAKKRALSGGKKFAARLQFDK